MYGKIVRMSRPRQGCFDFVAANRSQGPGTGTSGVLAAYAVLEQQLEGIHTTSGPSSVHPE
jgi:hypothetical protein